MTVVDERESTIVHGRDPGTDPGRDPRANGQNTIDKMMGDISIIQTEVHEVRHAGIDLFHHPGLRITREIIRYVHNNTNRPPAHRKFGIRLALMWRCTRVKN